MYNVCGLSKPVNRVQGDEAAGLAAAWEPLHVIGEVETHTVIRAEFPESLPIKLGKPSTATAHAHTSHIYSGGLCTVKRIFNDVRGWL